MKEFLDEVLATFDNATVVVTGYFQMICAGRGGTNPDTIRDLVASYFGLSKKKEKKVEKHEVIKHDWLIDLMSDHSAFWKKVSDDDYAPAWTTQTKRPAARGRSLSRSILPPPSVTTRAIQIFSGLWASTPRKIR